VASSEGNRSEADLRATAYHEAGHAVVTLALGLSIDSVSIIAAEDFNGVCRKPNVIHYGAVTKRVQKAIARAMIVALYAGMPAQRLVDPDAPAFHGESEDEEAFEVSRQWQVYPRRVRFIGDESHLAHLESLRQEARRLVLRNRAAVEVLAGELLQRKEMSGAEVQQLLGACKAPPAANPAGQGMV
jgi:ATP-dependent Zn protease